jgi:hypothetical protein
VLLSKRRQANAHDPKQTDFIITYALGTDKYIFYQTPSRTFITSFSTGANTLQLARGIHVGASKQTFEKAFKQKVSTVATVADTEQFQVYTFTFTQNVVSNIKYQCRLD